MNKLNFHPSDNFSALSSSLTMRAIIIGVLALLMTIPLGFVNETVNERGHRYASTLSETANTWAKPQTLMAAMIVVPYTTSVQTKVNIVGDDGVRRAVDRTKQTAHHAYFLPKTLDISVNMQDEIRQRGIFKSLVYKADVAIDAEFDRFDLSMLDGNNKKNNTTNTMHWEKAWLAVGLSDTRAINKIDTIQWQNTDKQLAPGTKLDGLPSGFHALLDTNQADFDRAGTKKMLLNMSIRGSGSFQFTPWGETTNVKITSSWPHPSFNGDALPNEHTISEDGFNASWTVPLLARNYQQQWTGDATKAELLEFAAGVSMFEPVSLYSQVTRAVKYGILFIALTFLTLFIFELAIDRKLHVVQYALIGVALSLFFLVLLSLSEHTEFIKAYAIAALLTISMISTYVWVALRSAGRAGLVFLMLCALYAVLCSLLQFEDFALLVGTGLLVFIVMALMFVTRNLHQDNADRSADRSADNAAQTLPST